MNLPPLTPRQHWELYGYYPNTLVTAVRDCQHVSEKPSLTMRVSHALRELLPGENGAIEGVQFKRSGCYKTCRFYIEGRSYPFKAAVAEVCRIASERRAEVAE